jgi:predicted DCC family thiol-disulfide oxidoreductase YuxK
MKATSHLVLFDGECPFCRAQVRLLERLDWLHLFRCLPRSDPRVGELAPSLALDQLPEAICCVPEGGGIYCGARCIRYLALRVPVLLPLGMVLWIPGIIRVADRVYGWIARNRHRLSRIGCRSGCGTGG